MQDTWLSPCLSPPRSINGSQRTLRETWRNPREWVTCDGIFPHSRKEICDELSSHSGWGGGLQRPFPCQFMVWTVDSTIRSGNYGNYEIPSNNPLSSFTARGNNNLTCVLHNLCYCTMWNLASGGEFWKLLPWPEKKKKKETKKDTLASHRN